MQCQECGNPLKLNHKKTIVDSLYKEYICCNGHRVIYRRFGYTVQIENKEIESSVWYSPTDRPEARKGTVRNILSAASTN